MHHTNIAIYTTIYEPTLVHFTVYTKSHVLVSTDAIFTERSPTVISSQHMNLLQALINHPL